jgi:hypothetical protein
MFNPADAQHMLRCRYQNLTDAEEAKKLRDARRFAKGLFYHLRGGYTRPYVVRDDFSPFFASKESADSAFSYFDKVPFHAPLGTWRFA